MTDQGWMVDDGTCTPCVHDNHHRCAEPIEEATDEQGVSLVCCCDEGYHLGWFDPAEEAP